MFDAAEDEGFYMDVDGPEFLLELNQEIASLRSLPVSTAGLGKNALKGLEELSKASSPAAGPSQEAPEPSKSQKEVRAVVLDTNFLLSNLQYLTQLGQCADSIDDPSSFKIVIPWTVVQELDKIKSRNGMVADQAKNALRYLEKNLRNQKPWIRVQKMTELHDQEFCKKSGKADDAILDCCLYFAMDLKYKTLLLSNDRNLSVKAMAHDIQSLSRETVGKLNELLESIGGKILADGRRVYEAEKKVRQKMELMERIKPKAADFDIEIPEELRGRKNYKKRRRFRLDAAKALSLMQINEDANAMEMDTQFPQVTKPMSLNLASSSIYSNTSRPSSSQASNLSDIYNVPHLQGDPSSSLVSIQDSASLDEDIEMMDYDDPKTMLAQSDTFKSKHAPKTLQEEELLIPPSSADEHLKMLENRESQPRRWRSTDESIWAPPYTYN